MPPVSRFRPLLSQNFKKVPGTGVFHLQVYAKKIGVYFPSCTVESKICISGNRTRAVFLVALHPPFRFPQAYIFFLKLSGFLTTSHPRLPTPSNACSSPETEDGHIPNTKGLCMMLGEGSAKAAPSGTHPHCKGGRVKKNLENHPGPGSG